MNVPRVATPVYGRGLLESLPATWFERPVVVTQPEPWDLVARHFDPDRTQRIFVQTMDIETVERIARALAPASAVFGVGGGLAMDLGKFLAWKRELPLVLVPSILSVDAAFTKAIAVREGRRVRYVGEVFPEVLFVDFDLLDAAPPRLNQAGVGDILSIFTALWDWREAASRLSEPYDAAVAAQARALLDRLFVGADDIAHRREAGYRLLADLYVGEVRLCEQVGNSRPEEGSEHYVAYCLEHQTGRSFVHGTLVCLGVLLAGAAQGQDLEPVRRFLREVGLDLSARAVGTTLDEVRQCVLGVADYLATEPQLRPGVFHFRGPLSRADVEALLLEAGLAG